MAKIPVWSTLGGAVRFVARDFGNILGVFWLPMLLLMVPSIWLQWQAVMQGVNSPPHRLTLLLQPVFIFLVAMQMLGIAQLALGLRTGPVWLYVSLGKPVWRLLGCWLLVAFFFLLAGLAAGFGGVLVTALLNRTLGMAAGALAGLAVLGLLVGGGIYCVVRLSFLLVPVIAMEEPKFALGRAWELGRGNFWRMFLISLIILLPLIVLELVLVFGFLFKGLHFPPPHAAAAQTALFQAEMKARVSSLARGVVTYWYVVAPLTVIFNVIFYGVAVGAQCIGYRALQSDPVTGNRLPD